MFIIRFVFYFTISFAILCIPVGNGNQLFDKLYSMVSPYADKAMNSTKQKFTATKRYSKKLYSNSEPLLKDEVKSRLAGTKKKSIQKGQSSDDTYTEEERERLKRALNDD